jgi:hypothetical protein
MASISKDAILYVVSNAIAFRMAKKALLAMTEPLLFRARMTRGLAVRILTEI